MVESVQMLKKTVKCEKQELFIAGLIPFQTSNALLSRLRIFGVIFCLKICGCAIFDKYQVCSTTSKEKGLVKG